MNEKEFTLSPNVVAHIGKLLSLSILSGTDISDHLLTMRLIEEKGKLELSPNYMEVQEKYIKIIFLDVGLCSAILGLSLDQLTTTTEMNLINKGGIAEQIVGQLLRTITPPFKEPALYYWLRTEKGANAELDYVIQHQNKVVPLEVKAGSTGSLKSLHLFMNLKKLSIAVRINADIPSITSVTVKNHEGKIIPYTLLSIPYYCLSELHRFLNSNQTV